jgi:hypothetical protein
LSEAEIIDVIASDIERPVAMTRSELEGYARNGLAQDIMGTAKKGTEV